MGYELRRLLDQYGVSTPTMAAAPQKPGEQPTALSDGATAEQQAKYAADKAVFDENVRKYNLNQAQYDQYARDYQNRLANTNMYNQAQFSTIGANVPAFTTFSDAQKAAMGMPPVQQAPVASPQVMPPVDAQPAPGPQDFAGTGQGGLNRYIQQYMGTNPSMPDMQNMQMRYGISDYDIRNAMGTGTQYGAPQWQDMLRSPVYEPLTAINVMPLVDTMNQTAAPPVENLDQRGRARGGYIKNYAQGGSVKGYQRGGPPGTIYGGAGDDEMMGGAEEDTLTTPAPAPVDPMAEMRAMLDLYVPPTVTSEQIAAASERRAAEQKAFEDILRSQLQGTDSAPQSKAEMYFRLAAAFGAPTKTGHFAENLGLVGEEMASQLSEKAKREREACEKRLGVDLEIQKMRMAAAGEDLEALQGVQSEEAKYRRDLGIELVKGHIASGKPASELGRQLADAGLVKGTPEYQEAMALGQAAEKEMKDLDVKAKIASIEAAQQRGNQMTATEINLRTETENNLASTEQSIKDVAEAYRLNPNSYAGGLTDKGLRLLQETAGSDDPMVVNTREIENLLGSQALASLKAIFGGSPTEGEKNILLELQGIGAKSKTERGEIMLRLYEVLKDRKARMTTRLDDIISGKYKTYEETADGE
jgi:hypothetical protein